jgi:hypothetical protein
VLRHWTDDVSGSYTKEIAVGDLPAGRYFIRVDGAQAGWSGSFLVVR